MQETQIYGWGQKDEDVRNVLHYYEEFLLPVKDCMWSPRDYYEFNQEDDDDSDDIPYMSYFDPDFHVCQEMSTSKGPGCYNDGGHPLVVKTEEDELYIVGIFSGFAPGGKCFETKTGNTLLVNYICTLAYTLAHTLHA